MSDPRYPIPPEEFAAIYARVPRLTVEVVAFTGAGLVLTRRSIEPCVGQWHLPGGTVRFGEHLRDAVRRVAENELGVPASVGRLLGYIEYPEMHREGYRGWPVGVAFEVGLLADELPGGDQSDQVGVFDRIPDPMIIEQARFVEPLLRARTVGGAGGTGADGPAPVLATFPQVVTAASDSPN